MVEKLGRIHSADSTLLAYASLAQTSAGTSACCPYNQTDLAALDHTPQRVASLQPSATVTLRDLGLLDRLVACTRYCADVCPEVADGSRVIVSDSWTAQSREILAAHPDLVLASVPYQLEAVAEILKAGVRFLGLAPRTLADIYADISAIAGVMGAWDRGQSVIGGMQGSIAEVREHVQNAHRPRVFCEEWGKPIIASQPWVAELVEAAGGEFVSSPGQTVTAEEVSDSKPDVILTAWCGAGDRVPLEKIVEQRGWTGLPAVQAARVFCINDELLNTPATSLIGGLHAIAWALHPELFQKPRGIRQFHSV